MSSCYFSLVKVGAHWSLLADWTVNLRNIGPTVSILISVGWLDCELEKHWTHSEHTDLCWLTGLWTWETLDPQWAYWSLLADWTVNLRNIGPTVSILISVSWLDCELEKHWTHSEHTHLYALTDAAKTFNSCEDFHSGFHANLCKTTFYYARRL